MESDFEERLASMCPQAIGHCIPKSPRTTRYNCLAWAVHDDQKQWYPKGDPERSRWPAGAVGDLDLPSVIEAFRLLGFLPSPSRAPEPGFERIALYIDEQGDVVHAARQLADGRWTSKLGTWEDVEHDTLERLEGIDYGKVGCILRRPAVTRDGDPGGGDGARDVGLPDE